MALTSTKPRRHGKPQREELSNSARSHNLKKLHLAMELFLCSVLCQEQCSAAFPIGRLRSPKPLLSVIHLSPSSSFLSVILALDPRTQDGRDFTP